MFELADAAGLPARSLVAYFDETHRAVRRRRATCCRGTTLADLVRARAPAAVAAAPRRARREALPADGELFERLRALRRALADAEGVPAYIVFSDAVLARMAAARPTDEAGLLAVSGVGPAKLARYGAAFLRVLRDG